MEDLEKKLELTEEILEELGKVMKLLKKGSNPLIGSGLFLCLSLPRANTPAGI